MWFQTSSAQTFVAFVASFADALLKDNNPVIGSKELSGYTAAPAIIVCLRRYRMILRCRRRKTESCLSVDAAESLVQSVSQVWEDLVPCDGREKNSRSLDLEGKRNRHAVLSREQSSRYDFGRVAYDSTELGHDECSGLFIVRHLRWF